MEHWFDLAGAKLRVLSEDAILLAPLLVYLGELASPPATAGFTLTLAHGEAFDRVPARAELVSEAMLPERRLGRLYAWQGWQWLVLPGELFLEIDGAARRARIDVRRGSEPLVGGVAGIRAIAAALACNGQHLVHGAALSLPQQDRAFLLLAPSGFGKTTSALALGLAGFGLLTDDAAVLDVSRSAESETARVWGLPRPFKVHRRTADLLPRIGAVLSERWDDNAEQGLTRARLAEVMPVPPVAAVPLTAVVLLGPRVSGEHVIRPARRSEILLRAATDNVFRGPAALQADDVRRFAAISCAVAAARGYELNVGDELGTLGSAMAGALG